jgi:plastocyanin
MGKGPIIAGLVVLIIVVGGAFALTSNSNSKSNNSSATTSKQSSTSTKSSATSSSSDTKAAAATITYDGSSFSPSHITVKSGDKVTVKNASSTNVQFDSDPHPVHTDDEDLNAGFIVPGDSKTFTVTQKGEFGYHNHLDPAQKGNITVQ